jgi:hypothetical protein
LLQCESKLDIFKFDVYWNYCACFDITNFDGGDPYAALTVVACSHVDAGGIWSSMKIH